jgi:hypothetical protein
MLDVKPEMQDGARIRRAKPGDDPTGDGATGAGRS